MNEFQDFDISNTRLVTLPEELDQGLQQFLEQRPDWSQDRALTAALSMFLMQTGECDRRVNQIYLDATFDRR